MGLNIQNLTNQNISFEATSFSAQGHHLTARALIPAGQTVDVATFLPKGMTHQQLAQSRQVLDEFNRVGGPRYNLVPTGVTAAKLLSQLTANYNLGVTQTTGAAVTTPGLFFGAATRAGQATKLRITTVKAIAVGESLNVTTLNQNGVNILPSTLTLPASSTARSFVEAVLNSPVSDGDVFEGIITYTAGGGPTIGAVRYEVIIATQ